MAELARIMYGLMIEKHESPDDFIRRVRRHMGMP
jgi:hypothetical protein